MYQADPEINELDLVEYLDRNSSFAFEARIDKALSDLDFAVDHGGTYIDGVTGKIRQYDLRARHFTHNKTAFLAVECKNLSPANPLLVHRLPRKVSEASNDFFFFPANGLPEIERDRGGGQLAHPPYPLDTSEGYAVRLTERFSFYPKGELVGKSMDQVSRRNKGLTGSDADVFEKMSQAISSGLTLINEVSFRELDGGNHFCIVVPILVVPNDTLWLVDYGVGGTRSTLPTRADRTSFYIDRPSDQRFMGDIGRPSFSHMEILTERGLVQFAKSKIIDSASGMPPIYGDREKIRSLVTQIQNSVVRLS